MVIKKQLSKLSVGVGKLNIYQTDTLHVKQVLFRMYSDSSK